MANEIIKTYLEKNGKMSGWDIVNDCNVEEVDVELAEQQGMIIRTSPCSGGAGPWFRLR